MLGWIDKEYLYSYVYDYIGTTDVSRNSAKVSSQLFFLNTFFG